MTPIPEFFRQEKSTPWCPCADHESQLQVRLHVKTQRPAIWRSPPPPLCYYIAYAELVDFCWPHATTMTGSKYMTSRYVLGMPPRGILHFLLGAAIQLSKRELMSNCPSKSIFAICRANGRVSSHPAGVPTLRLLFLHHEPPHSLSLGRLSHAGN